MFFLTQTNHARGRHISVYQMPTYHAEKSKSARAGCKAKGCGEKIPKGEYRVGTTSLRDE